jgi:hypothetical protein
MSEAQAAAVPERRRKLADAIREIFAEGIHLDEAVQHFIESSVSDAAPETVAEVLESPSDFGAEPLMELIFFPEEDHQIRLEPLLEAERFDERDIAAVEFHLSEPPLEARLGLSWTGTEVILSPPAWVVAEFLKRLRIDWQGDAEILAALDKRLEEETARRFRVMMRNARFHPSERTRPFLVHFLERFEGNAADLRDAFDFLLGFLPGMPPNQPIYGALLDRKRRAQKALSLAQDAETRREKSNMEILLMQGFRASHVDVPAVERELTLLDGIFYAVFDRAPATAMEASAETEPVSISNLNEFTNRLAMEGD